jgi:hypothetical protein
MDFRFTLFNSITLFIMALTLAAAFARFRLRPASPWFGVYYLVLAGFWKGFDGSLNSWWLAYGIACAVLLHFSSRALSWARIAECAFFGYVLWRCVGLLLLW